MLGDLSVIGPQATLPRRVAAAATRFYTGEPFIQASATSTSGVATANVFTPAAIDVGVIGTDNFGGVALENAEPKNSSDALTAQTVNCACPVGYLGRVRGKAETKASIDTDAEILLIIQDDVLIDYAATGSPTSGPLYTIQEVAAATTSAFQIVAGDPTTGTLDVIVDPRFYRIANDIT